MYSSAFSVYHKSFAWQSASGTKAVAANKPRAQKDKLGRERCYDNDGKLVPCNHPDELDANDPDTPAEQAQQRTRLQDADLLTDKDQTQQPEPEQDTSDPQFQAEWDKVVSEMIGDVTANDVGTHAFSPEEVAAEQNWHSEFIQWRWGLQMPGQESNAGKFAITPADVGPAARFMSGLLNPALGGARYIAGLLDKWSGAGKPKQRADAALGDELQAFFDRMNPNGEANKSAAELAAAVLGPQAAPIAKELAKASPYTETTAPTAEQRAAAGPVQGPKSKDANVRGRVEKAKKQAQAKAKKQAAMTPEQQAEAKQTASEKLKAKRIKQEARGEKQRASQEKQDRRFAVVKDVLTDAELEAWWKLPPKQRNEFLSRKEREAKSKAKPTAERLKNASSKSLFRYGTKDGRWVTMPANGEGGGGTPVYIDDAGEIRKGPKGTVGKKPDELSDKKPAAKEEEKPKPKRKIEADKPEPTKKPEAVKPAEKESDGPSAPEVDFDELDRLQEEVFNGPKEQRDERKRRASQAKQEADSRLSAYIQDHTTFGQLDESQQQAVRKYQSDTYYKILNHGLRQDGKPPKKLKEMTDQLDAAISASKLPAALKVYRGLGSLGVFGGDPSKAIGKTFVDRAYASTTLSRHVAQDFGDEAVVEIDLPKGSSAMLVPSSKQFDEHEVLLGRESKFRVKSAERKGDRWHIKVELV